MAINISDETASTGDIAFGREIHAWAVWLLLVGGTLIVAFAPQIGLSMVEHCTPSGNCGWSPEDADRATTTWRLLGSMAFVAGLVERATIAITSKEPA